MRVLQLSIVVPVSDVLPVFQVDSCCCSHLKTYTNTTSDASAPVLLYVHQDCQVSNAQARHGCDISTRVNITGLRCTQHVCQIYLLNLSYMLLLSLIHSFTQRKFVFFLLPCLVSPPHKLRYSTHDFILYLQYRSSLRVKIS
jgi:hypothetical protein